MTTIDKKKAESLLRAAVRKRGKDTVTPMGKCVYQIKGQPSCIVGEVVAAATDHPVTEIFRGRSKGDGFYEINNTRFSTIRRDIERQAEIRFTDGAADLLNEAQDYQDNQVPWGQVLDKVLPKR